MSASSTIRNHIVLGLFCLTLSGLMGKEVQARDRTHSCGPLALKTCLSLLGTPVEASVCAGLAGTTEGGDTTMAGLVRAAKQFGQKVVSMSLTQEELAMLNRPAILHVSYPNADEHFAVCASSDNHMFELINPSLAPGTEIVTAEQLGAIWDNKCIVFTETPLLDMMKVLFLRCSRYLLVLGGLAIGCCVARASRHQSKVRKKMLAVSLGAVVLGAVIQVGFSDILRGKPKQPLLLGADVLDFGDVPLGTPVSRDTWYANIGRDALRINRKNTRASCSCLKMKVEDEVLTPGQEGILKLRLGPKTRRGKFEHRAHVAVHGQKEGGILAIRGNIVGPGVAFPPRLYFGRVRPGETPVRTFLYVPKYPDFELLHIEGSSPSVRCEVQQISSDVARVSVSLESVPSDGQLQGNVRLVVKDREESEIEIPFEGFVAGSS